MTPISTEIDQLYVSHLNELQVRYESVLSTVEADGFLIASGELIETFLDDQTYPFKVNPHFNQWLPVTDNPGSFVVFRPGCKPVLLFHQADDYWHKPPADPSGFWVREWDIRTISSFSEVSDCISDLDSPVFIGAEHDLATALKIEQINPTPVLDALHFDRSYKTEFELGCIQLANNTAVEGHRTAKAAFEQRLSEFDIQHCYLKAIRHREQSTPYPGIVGLNENCAVLHYQHYETTPPDEFLSLLIDAGACQYGYAADVTRTYAANPGRFQELINAVDEQQQAIIDDIEPGINYMQLHEKMHLRVCDLLKQFNLINMSPEAMLENDISRTFLPHGLGHMLGLQTHDVAGFQQSRQGANLLPDEKSPALRLTRNIEERQVFTIEPGIYFIPSLLSDLRDSKSGKDVNWLEVEKLIPYGGIRIEDNITIRDGNVVNLTRNAFANSSS